MYRIARVTSTQKLPIDEELRRTRPRMSATAMAMPAAADVKLRTARPAALDEVAGPLARVVLPVGVGLEADGRVEGQLGREGRVALGFSGRTSWSRSIAYMSDDADEAEEQQGHGVALPALLGRLVDAADAVDATFDRPQDGAQERPLPRP